ncbi:MAG: hypothetical protein JXA33_16915 [Anaerolineae bacterium]|nr:hypothetical protein [Anaerolineae bacterium]
MRPQLEVQGTSIVLRGQFNPAMFHPAWFAAQNLIRQQEAEAADVKIIHTDLALFDVEWLQVSIIKDRFMVATIQQAYYEALRDLVVGAFTLFNHTPLRVIGINREFHYALASEKAWHAVGDRLAPKQYWNDFLNKPGMKSLTIQDVRPDALPGYVNIKVEPSPRIRFGIYVDINDHYVLSASPEGAQTTDEAIEILTQHWVASMERSQDMTQRIANLGDSDIW